MLRRFIILSLILELGMSSPLFATIVVAKKDGVAVLKDARKDASPLIELRAGQKLEAESRTGMYWKVKLPSGGMGYISVLSVQHQAAEDNGLQTALRNEAMAARKNVSEESNARARSAVMGVRGLSASQELSSAGQLRPDTSAVYRMEDRLIEPDRIQGLEELVMEELSNTLKAREQR